MGKQGFTCLGVLSSSITISKDEVFLKVLGAKPFQETPWTFLIYMQPQPQPISKA